jgi:hypothetical protein
MKAGQTCHNLWPHGNPASCIPKYEAILSEGTRSHIDSKNLHSPKIKGFSFMING